MRKRWWISAAVSVVPGMFFIFGYSPMRFSGYLLLGLAGWLLLMGFLEARRENRYARIAGRILSLLTALGLTVFAVLEYHVVSYGLRADNAASRETPVSAVVILGAGVNGTRPSLSLQVRLEAALEYLKDKPDIPIVVSGSQGPGEDISEARCMADWLIDRGVAAERILLEEQADNTQENIRYSVAVLAEHGVDTTDNIAVVTADYHLFRALLHWSVPWMVPVAAHMPEEFLPLTVSYYIREAFAVGAWLIFSLR